MPEKGTKPAGTDSLSKNDRGRASVNEGDLKEGERRRSGQHVESEDASE